MAVREGDEVLRLDSRRELPGDHRPVLGAGSEGDEGPDVPQDGIPQLAVKLAQVLMGKRQADAVLTELGQHRRQGERGEDLELVQVDEEGASLLLRQFGTGETGQRERRDQERAQERGRPFAHAALGEIDQEDLSLVHDLPRVKGARLGGEDAVEDGVREEGANLVLQGRDDHRPEGRRVALVLPLPEVRHLGVRQAADGRLPEVLVGEELGDVSQSRSRELQERQEDVSEKVLQSRPPVLVPELLEGLHQAGGGQRPLLLRDACQGVEGPGRGGVGGIQVEDVLPALRRDVVEKGLHQVAVRVQKSQATAGGQVLGGHGLQEC